MNTKTMVTLRGDDFVRQEMAQAANPKPDVIVIDSKPFASTPTTRGGGRLSRSEAKRKSIGKKRSGKKERPKKKKLKADVGYVLNPNFAFDTRSERKPIEVYSKNIDFDPTVGHSSIERERECKVIRRVTKNLERDKEVFRILFGK
jgi:hypothetical protein